MGVEQVARDFVMAMNDMEALKARITADAIASGGVLPQPLPLLEAFQVMDGLTAGMPDMKFTVEEVMLNGNRARVYARWSGTQTGPLRLPGIPAVPPTGKKVWVKDTYILTVEGDKVSVIEIDSPVGGGIPGALAQLGVKIPAM